MFLAGIEEFRDETFYSEFIGIFSAENVIFFNSIVKILNFQKKNSPCTYAVVDVLLQAAF